LIIKKAIEETTDLKIGDIFITDSLNVYKITGETKTKWKTILTAPDYTGDTFEYRVYETENMEPYITRCRQLVKRTIPKTDKQYKIKGIVPSFKILKEEN
jgi:hypothetical protein